MNELVANSEKSPLVVEGSLRLRGKARSRLVVIRKNSLLLKDKIEVLKNDKPWLYGKLSGRVFRRAIHLFHDARMKEEALRIRPRIGLELGKTYDIDRIANRAVKPLGGIFKPKRSFRTDDPWEILDLEENPVAFLIPRTQKKFAPRILMGRFNLHLDCDAAILVNGQPAAKMLRRARKMETSVEILVAEGFDRELPDEIAVAAGILMTGMDRFQAEKKDVEKPRNHG